MEMKKSPRAIDLALAACRRRQSKVTGYLHYFEGDDTVRETIPFYENLCFVWALFCHKTVDSVLEGKELLLKLLAFQTGEGNFPVFLHDYPKSWDRLLPLKAAPLLIRILREYASCLDAAVIERMGQALQKSLSHIKVGREERSLSPLWEMRYQACLGVFSPSAYPTRANEWLEWILSAQLASTESLQLPVPYSEPLQAFLGDLEEQERGEPKPHPIEWMLAEKEGYQERLRRDHPHQIYAALLKPFVSTAVCSQPSVFCPLAKGGFRLLWKGESLHSLFTASRGEGDNLLVVPFHEAPQFLREDLLEVSLFTDASPETKLFINGQRGTLFRLGDTVSIETPSLRIELVFSLEEGTGDFCGLISRSNRPGQTRLKGAELYEAYDWQIALRTLRRSDRALLTVHYKVAAAVPAVALA